MSIGGSELTETEHRARKALDAMGDNALWQLGEYSMGYAGRSYRISVASEFCDEHDVDRGDHLTAYLHSDTGALILLPAPSQDKEA